MSEREIDFELIAAYIDGRLSGDERRRAAALLAQSEAAFEVYASALGARADLVGDATVPITAGRRRRGPGGWWAMAPLAAAAALFVAVFPAIQKWQDAAALRTPAMRIAGTVAEQPLRGDWDERPWSVTRGGESRLVDSTTAFRLGVRSVDLQVALSAGDTALARQLASEMAGLLDRVSAADLVKADYLALSARIPAGGSRDSLVSLAAAAEQSADAFFDSQWFALGKWFAAGELAARTHSAAFFASRETGRVLDAAVERQHLPPEDVQLLREVAALRGQGVSAEEFEPIQRMFLTLIRRHGG